MDKDKNQAVVDFLLTCPAFIEYQLYFNYAEAEDNTSQFITMSDKVKETYIDGSNLKTYTFNLVSYKSVSHTPLIESSTDENIEDMQTVQAIIDWVNEQGRAQNFPDFGEGYIVETMHCLTDDPDLFAIDTNVNPPLAKYSVVIQLEYLDTTQMLWNK